VRRPEEDDIERVGALLELFVGDMELSVEGGALGGQVVVAVPLAVRCVDHLTDKTHPVVHQLFLLALLHRLEVKLLLAAVDRQREVPPAATHLRTLRLEVEGLLDRIAVSDGELEVLELDFESLALGGAAGTAEKQAKKPSVSEWNRPVLAYTA
jgi:hypothetical protein